MTGGTDIATCGVCGLSWDDSIVTGITPAPAARCPFEHFHEYDDDGEPIPLGLFDIPAGFEVTALLPYGRVWGLTDSWVRRPR